MKTLKSWCKDGFDDWLASRNGEGTMSWILGSKSKFSQDQVLQWFALKDELYQSTQHNNEDSEENLDDDTSMSDISNDQMGINLIIFFPDIKLINDYD
jgi:hypothetical protein